MPWRGFVGGWVEHALLLAKATLGGLCRGQQALPTTEPSEADPRRVAVPRAWSLCTKLRLGHVLKLVWQYLAGRKDLWKSRFMPAEALALPRAEEAKRRLFTLIYDTTTP